MLLNGPSRGPAEIVDGSHADRARRFVAEAIGTGLLVVAVVGSGIMASRMSTDGGVQLLANAVATAGALAALIVAFGSVSGAHLNPLVTVINRVSGAMSTRDAIGYVVAQLFGACLGAVAANVMFELSPIVLSHHTRSAGSLWFSEALATFALLVIIHGCAHSGRSTMLPFAVGAWIGGAYWFTSSTSFANPAVTVARTLSDTFAGIAPQSAPMFVVAQLAGAGVATVFVRFVYPSQPTGVHA